MVNVLEMDLTGTKPANKVTEDIKLSRQNRAFPLGKGSFYTKTLRVVNKATQALMTLGKDYRLGEIDIEAIRFTPQHEICKEIVILNNALEEITVEYQAVGGEFQFSSTSLATMLQEYFDTIGKTHIVNTPDQYPALKHVQNINDFNKLGGIKNSLDRIEQAILNGKSAPLINAMLAYTEELGAALSKDVKAQADELMELVQFLKRRNEYRDGRYYITSRPNNPAAEKGGIWALDSNVLLYGANNYSEVGQLINVGEGAGLIATLRHLWRRSDTGIIVVYELSSSATDIDEGDSVTINVKVRGLATGDVVPWKITGIDADDIVGGKLTGSFTLDNNGFASAQFTMVRDRKTEGKEVMRLTLTNAPTNYINVGINDTSNTPLYTTWFSSDVAGNNIVTSLNEGVEAYLQLGGNDLNQGERLYILLDESTTTVDDFEIPLPAYLDIDNGRATAKFKMRADELSEGLEMLVVNISTSTSLNNRVVRNSLNIIDTSKAASYRAKFVSNADGSGSSLTQANEGTVVYLVIDGDDLKEGTIVQLQYFGQVTQDDFVNALSTSAQITNGKAIIQYSIKNDIRTEGNESFGISVLSGGVTVATASLTVIDTSITMGYDMYFSSTSAGSDRITSINEGDACYLLIRTIGVADGIPLALSYGGQANASDFNGMRPTSVIVTGGLAIVNFSIANDRSSEGTELFTVFLPNVNDAPQASISIIDTSISPTISTKFSSNDRGTDVITNTPEGRSVYLIVQTSNVLDGESLALAYSGAVNDSDFDAVRPTSVTINNNLGVVEYKVKADALEEGSERFDVTVAYVGKPISSTTGIDILDTSKPPKLELTVYVAGQQITDLANLVALPGQAIEVRVTDVNRTLSDNAIIYFNYNFGIGIAPKTLTNRLNGSLPTTIQMSNWVARLNFTYSPEMHYQATFTPLAFGLSAAEAASTGAQTDTFRFVNIKLDVVSIESYFSATQNGVPYTGAITANKPLWYVLKSNNVVNGTSGTLRIWVDGTYATVANGLLSRDYTGLMTFNNGFASQLIYPKASAYNGVKRLEAFMQNNSMTATIPNTTVSTVLLPPPIETAWYLGPIKKDLLLAAGETIEIVMVGAGGGGGGSRYTGGNFVETMKGGPSAGASIYILHPGGLSLLGDFDRAGGGGEGWWGNGSHYDNGAAGIGAVVEIWNTTNPNYVVEEYRLVQGVNGMGGWSQRRDGGSNLPWDPPLPQYVQNLTTYGKGGWGAAGVGDNGWSYGGGGGTGGMGYFKIRNTASVPITIQLDVGEPGVAGLSGRNGEPGANGAVWYRQLTQ